MKVIVRPRQHGKTLELIKLCYLNPGYIILVPNQMYKKSVEKLARTHGFGIPDMFTIDEIKISKRSNIRKDVTGVLIDNAEYILAHIFDLYGNYSIKAICIDGLKDEVDYDEGKDYMEYKSLTYQQYRELKDDSIRLKSLNNQKNE